MSEARAPADEMPPYEVVNIGYADVSDGHEHVAFIETKDPDGGETRWAWLEVVGAIRAGERFVAASTGGKAAAILELSVCPVCPAATPRYRSPAAR